MLRQWDTPVQGQSWGRLAFDWTLVALFLSVVLPLRRLGRARALFFRSARRQRDELVREVEMAAALQRQLLDQHRPPAGPLDVVARTEPAKVVGGDYYDFVPLPDGRLAVVIADVSGKGLPAALLMPAVKIALRTLAERHADGATLLAELNRIFLDNLPPASYFTLIYAVFDPGARAPRLRERRAPSRAASAGLGRGGVARRRGRGGRPAARRRALRGGRAAPSTRETSSSSTPTASRDTADAAGLDFEPGRIAEAARGAEAPLGRGRGGRRPRRRRRVSWRTPRAATTRR